MTVIVGIEARGGAALAWDTAISDHDAIDVGFRKVHTYTPKFAVGFAGDVDAAQAIIHGWKPPKSIPMDLVKWLAFVVPKAWRKLTSDFHKPDYTALIAVRGQLWAVGGGTHRSSRGYAAIGSGAAWAEGVCYRRVECDRPTASVALDIATEAVECACEHGRALRAPDGPGYLWVPA